MAVVDPVGVVEARVVPGTGRVGGVVFVVPAVEFLGALMLGFFAGVDGLAGADLGEHPLRADGGGGGLPRDGYPNPIFVGWSGLGCAISRRSTGGVSITSSSTSPAAARSRTC